MDLKKSDTETSSSNNNSVSSFLTATLQSVFTRPRKEGKLKDVFGKNGRPSPPQNRDGTVVDMDIADVEQRMKELGFIIAFLPTDRYEKLGWIIGKGLDKIILEKQGPFWGRIRLRQLLQPTDHMGKRFDAIYRGSDGDFTFPSNEICPIAFMKQHLGVDAWSEDSRTYTIYSDSEHPNVEYFCRELTCSGNLQNCSMQGPILAHWILSLWQDKDKRADDVRMIHMSNYLRRNALAKNDALYNHILEERRDYWTSQRIASLSMPQAFGNSVVYSGVFEFEQVVDQLKKRGPALVDMHHLFQDFLEEGKLVYEGVPPEGSEPLPSGHGMLLIGLFKDETTNVRTTTPPKYMLYHHFRNLDDNLRAALTQVYLLLQNWWPGKPFIKMRLDYFLHCDGCITFSNGNKVKEVTNESYSEKTNHIRRAVTAASLERGITRPGGVKSAD